MFSLTKRNIREKCEGGCPAKYNFRRKPGVFYSSKRKGGLQTKIFCFPEVKASFKQKFIACPDAKSAIKREFFVCLDVKSGKKQKNCSSSEAKLDFKRKFYTRPRQRRV